MHLKLIQIRKIFSNRNYLKKVHLNIFKIIKINIFFSLSKSEIKNKIELTKYLTLKILKLKFHYFKLFHF